MADYTNIPTGLKVPSQIPLNTKTYIKNEAALKDLGVDSNLAFTYHKGLEITCLDERKKYVWQEVGLIPTTGLLATDFVYPAGLTTVFGYDYSNKSYNFYEVVANSTKTYSVSNIGTGTEIYKEAVVTGNNTEFKLKKIAAKDSSIEITESGDTILFKSNSTGPSVVTNPQKRISGVAYTLLPEDFGVSLIVDNGDVETIMFITIPKLLPEGFIVYLVQMGLGDVIIEVDDDANQILNTPIGTAIKGQFYHIAIEKILTTEEFNILGNTKIYGQ